MTSSLDRNTFYRSLVTTHHAIFEEASNNCWTICVPTNKKLSNVKMDASLIRAHCLRPSPFLKDHYIPVNNAYVRDVGLKQDQLLVTQSDKTESVVSVKVLGAEDAYNSKNQRYRILIIDRPLTSEELNVSVDEEDPDGREVVTCDECRQYLISLSPVVVREIDDKLNRLMLTSSIFEDDINNVVSIFTSITNAAVHKLTQSCLTLDDVTILEYATESLVLHPFHDKLMQTIIRIHKDEGEIITQNCVSMVNQKLDMRTLGSEVDLESFVPKSEVKDMINSFDTKTTPFEKMVTFRNVLNLIREDLTKCIEENHSPFDPSPLRTLVPDDLVAALIFTLTHSNCADQIYYHLNFMQTFGTHLPLMNELAYAVVTFEVALAYIRNYNESRSQHKESEGSNQSDENERYPWQETEDDTNNGQRDRSNSLSSFRIRDPRFDKQLKELSRMVENISLKESAREEYSDSESGATAATTGDEDEEDLGAFLSSFNRKKFTVHYGKLS